MREECSVPMITCADCGYEKVGADAKICPQCGTNKPFQCPGCGKRLSAKLIKDGLCLRCSPRPCSKCGQMVRSGDLRSVSVRGYSATQYHCKSCAPTAAKRSNGCLLLLCFFVLFWAVWLFLGVFLAAFR